MSKETGISVDTLKMIKQVETKVNDNKKKNVDYMLEQEGKKDLQQLIQLANQIRFMFTTKRSTTMPMAALVKQIQDKSQGDFFSKEERVE